jgi:hypothetical protein
MGGIFCCLLLHANSRKGQLLFSIFIYQKNESRTTMKCWNLLFVLLLVQSSTIFAIEKPKLPDKVPDLPARATIFIENTGKPSTEAERFTRVLQSVISRSDDKHDRIRPGLTVVDSQSEADYVLRYEVFAGEREPGCNMLTCSYAYTQGNFRATVLLLSSHGTKLWEQEYHCFEPMGGESAEKCADHLANDVKGAQVDENGERAGAHGWKKEFSGPVRF